MLVDSMNDEVIEILPAVHAHGYDTSSKIGTKVKALKAAETNGNEVLCFFGKSELTENMIDDAEKYLLHCVSHECISSFDELRNDTYHKKLQQFDLEKFPPTSSSIRQHTLRAYLQCHLWYHVLFTFQ